MRGKFLAILTMAMYGWLASCTVRPPPPIVATAPPATVYTTSFVCQNGNTPVQNVVCGNQQLAALDVQMAGIYRQRLAGASLFGRDQLLANQRTWLLALPAQCNVTKAVPGPDVTGCLASAYVAQIGALTNWPVPAGAQTGAITNYVTYKLLDAKQPQLCASLQAQAASAMTDEGALDPGRLDGAQEIAGSHGAASGTLPGGENVTVDLYRAGLYGSYQIRARGLALNGASLLGPDSLGAYVEALPNGGGRFVSFASQTEDYGDIDVFTLNGQAMALVTDVIGYDSPAPPGEASVAGLYLLAPGSAAPACLFETYLMPPPLDESVFSEQPSLTPFLALVDSIHGPSPSALAPSDRQDSSAFADEARWTLLNMPLVGVAQAAQGGWVNWLRHRHDDVLDALYGWSRQSPQNAAQFQQFFALARPAAEDLDTIYVQRQGLSASQAQQATALTMMELFYQAADNLAPTLGGTAEIPAAEQSYQPRYPILATPD
jgi:uncharacterized protein